MFAGHSVGALVGDVDADTDGLLLVLMDEAERWRFSARTSSRLTLSSE